MEFNEEMKCEETQGSGSSIRNFQNSELREGNCVTRKMYVGIIWLSCFQSGEQTN